MTAPKWTPPDWALPSEQIHDCSPWCACRRPADDDKPDDAGGEQR